MGTRNLTCVVVDGETKIAQYGQWDGYPEGQGATVCEFLQACDMEKFKQSARECEQISKEEHEDVWVACGAERGTDFVPYDVGQRVAAEHPELSRDTGAEILQLVMDGVRKVNLREEFAADGLFCEWAYVVDLDNETLEVYTGFVKDEHNKGRFAEKFADSDAREEGYAPVALEHVIPLSEIREKGKDALLELYQEEAEAES